MLSPYITPSTGRIDVTLFLLRLRESCGFSMYIAVESGEESVPLAYSEC
jgi:hypothetical protein